MNTIINNPKYLISYWPLNSHIDDVSGRGNNFYSPVGNFITGIDGQGKTFYKSQAAEGLLRNDNFNIFDSVRTSKEISFCCWFNVNSSIADFSPIYLKEDANFSPLNGREFHAYIHRSARNFRISIGYGPSLHVDVGSGTNTIDFDVWQHFVVTVNFSQKTIKFYKNGIFISQTSNSNLNTTDFFVQRNSPSVLAGIFNNTTSLYTYINGLNLKNIRMYNIELSNDEVNDIYLQESMSNKLIPCDCIANTIPVFNDPSLIAAYLTDNNITKDSVGFRTLATNVPATIYPEKNSLRFISSTASCLFRNTFGIFNNTGKQTVSVWLRPLSKSGTGDPFVIGYFAGSGAGNRLYINQLSTGVFAITFGDLTQYSALTISEYEIGEWINIVLIRDGNASGGTQKIYVNGVLKQSINKTLGTDDSTFRIGGGTTTRSFNGEVRDVEIYNEEKSAEWIKEKYRKVVPDDSLRLRIIGGRDVSKFGNLITNNGVISMLGMSEFGKDTTNRLTIGKLGSSIITNYNGFTFSFWSFSKSLGGGPSGRIMQANSSNGWYILNNNPGSGNKLSLRFSFSIGEVGSTTLELNRWIFWSIVFNGSSLYIYKNSILMENIPTSVTPSEFNHNLIIGNDSSNIRTFDGFISDFRIYNEIKSPSWIKNEYLKTRQFY